ncbi:hypothetical protein DYB38_013633, partial [Aphanomyces astaci]
VQVDSDAVFASVLDGHGGWEVAEYVNKHLVNNTAALLRDAAFNNPAASNDPTHVTCATPGDVRAVLASNDAWRGLVATPLSTDHNAKHVSEQNRLTEKHPNETDVVVCRSPESCRVKGILQPTR